MAPRLPRSFPRLPLLAWRAAGFPFAFLSQYVPLVDSPVGNLLSLRHSPVHFQCNCGQYVICTETEMFVCGCAARIGQFQCSYCTRLDTPNSRPARKSACTLASFSVPPAGMKSELTLACRYANCKLFRALNAYLLQACNPCPSLPIQLPMMFFLFI